MPNGAFQLIRASALAVVVGLVVACSTGEPADDEVFVEEPTDDKRTELVEEFGDAPCADDRWDEEPPAVQTLEQPEDD